jgi:putative nucleotidyltransferase with HDIG domain
MGAFKPLLPLGKGTVIKQAVANFRQTGIEKVHIVLGNRAGDIIAHLEDMDVTWVVNEDFHNEMLTSVQIGVRQLSSEIRAFFLQPVDIPLIRSQTLQALMRANAAYPHSIVYPVFNAARGHPPLVPRTYAGAIVNYQGTGGLRGCLQAHENNAVDIAVADEGILMDMDTQEQYEQIKHRYQKWMIPSKAECLAMLAFRFAPTDPLIRHAQTVAGLAQGIAARLNAAGHPIDEQLVTACAYLHDIGKGVNGHAQIGAEMLTNFGYPQIAAIIASHMDLEFNAQDGISEKEVLFLADKKISGTRIMALDERLAVKLKQFANNPDGRVAVERRLGTAMKIEARIEKIIGRKTGAD